MYYIKALLGRTCSLGRILGWLGLCFVTLLLGAHFYRGGQYGLALSALGIVGFFSSSSSWKQYAAAFFLMWGMIEWGESAYVLAKMRMHFDQPYMRGSLILLTVGLVTGFAGNCAYRSARKKDTDSPQANAGLQGGVFIATFLCLFYIRQAAHLEFLLLERYLPLVGSVQIFFISWYAAFVAGKLLNPKTSRKMRKIFWTAFACIFFIQFFLGLFGMQGMLLTGKLHVPIPAFIIFAPIFRESFSMMPIIVFIATLFVGSAWCSMLCYFGPFDSFAAGKKRTAPCPDAIRKMQEYGRPLMLVAGSCAALLLRQAGIATSAAISIAVIFTLVSLFIMAFFSRKYHGMMHCTMFCPLGIVVDLLGKISPWRIRVNAGRCDGCGACEAVCKYSAITAQSRAAGKTLLRCSLCRDCIGVCKSGAISLYCPGLSYDAAQNLFVAILSVLHALFLGIAMV